MAAKQTGLFEKGGYVDVQRDHRRVDKMEG